MEKTEKRSRLSGAGPMRWEYLLAGVLLAAAFLLCNHPDIMETARHSYILIRSTLDGNFLQFYEDTLQRTYGYWYVNAAHYNILMYILYALWILPVYLAEHLFGFAVGDVFLAMWCKCIGVGFYLGCGVLLGRLAEKLGCSPAGCRWMPLLFWMNPISFFTTVVMGQYDSLCLFFLLWALLAYYDKRYLRFSLIMGVGFVFKFFPLFLFIPLLLLVEKRPLQWVKYGLVSLWLYLPTTLLFRGRTGDAGVFNQLMSDRLFAAKFPGGAMDASLFGLSMVLVCVAAYLYRPASEEDWHRVSAYGGLLVFSLLFMLVLWHPQWLILLVPFVLLVQLQQQEQTGYAYLQLAFCIGFFLLTAFLYPRGLEGNLLDFGILRPLTGWFYSAAEQIRYNSFYFALVPYLTELMPLLFYGPLLAWGLFALPVHGRSLSDRLAGKPVMQLPLRLYVWGSFVVALGGFWAVPTLFSYLKTIGLL